jgi:tetratricopeptide (TPR) repeat protein
MPFWRRRDVTALYIACFVYVGTMLIFYIRGRYRIPAAPFLMLFSAVAIERLWNAMAARRWQSVGVLAAGLVVAGVFTNQRYCEAAHDGMNAVCLGGDTWFDQEWLKLAEWYRNKGDLERAVGYGERAAECSSPRSAGQIAFWIGELHKMRAEELVQQGRRDEAAPHLARAEASLRQATQLGYRKGMAHSTLGSLLALAGKPAEAVASFEAARALGSMDAAATQRFAQSYVALGRCADGERLLAKLDRERGFTGPSDDTRVILSACGAGK